MRLTMLATGSLNLFAGALPERLWWRRSARSWSTGIANSACRVGRTHPRRLGFDLVTEDGVKPRSPSSDHSSD